MEQEFRSEIKIASADESLILKATELSQRTKMEVRDKKVLSLGIHHPISKGEIKHIFVAVDKNGEVVGALKAERVPEDDFDWFEVGEESELIEISKVCVDEKFRGKHIASEMLEYVKRLFPNSNLYADVLQKPIENTASEKAFFRSGFEKIKQKRWFHKDFNATFVWGIFRFFVKNNKKLTTD